MYSTNALMSGAPNNSKVVISLCGLNKDAGLAGVCMIESETLRHQFQAINLFPVRPELKTVYGLKVDGQKLNVTGNSYNYPGVGTERSDSPKIVLLAKIRNSDYYLTYTVPMRGTCITLLNVDEMTKLVLLGYQPVNFGLSKNCGFRVFGADIPKVGHNADIHKYKQEFRCFIQATSMIQGGVVGSYVLNEQQKANGVKTNGRMSNTGKMY